MALSNNLYQINFYSDSIRKKFVDEAKNLFSIQTKPELNTRQIEFYNLVN